MFLFWPCHVREAKIQPLPPADPTSNGRKQNPTGVPTFLPPNRARPGSQPQEHRIASHRAVPHRTALTHFSVPKGQSAPRKRRDFGTSNSRRRKEGSSFSATDFLPLNVTCQRAVPCPPPTSCPPPLSHTQHRRCGVTAARVGDRRSTARTQNLRRATSAPTNSAISHRHNPQSHQKALRLLFQAFQLPVSNLQLEVGHRGAGG